MVQSFRDGVTGLGYMAPEFMWWVGLFLATPAFLLLLTFRNRPSYRIVWSICFGATVLGCLFLWWQVYSTELWKPHSPANPGGPSLPDHFIFQLVVYALAFTSYPLLILT